MDFELIHCPFCGSDYPFLVKSVGEDRPYSILCECGGRVGWFETKEEAVEAWNRRVDTNAN